MQFSLKPIAAATVVAASLLVNPAQASAAMPTLVLSMKNQDALLGNSVTLGCDEGEATGSHPHRKQACAAIQDANGKFEHLKNTNRLCTMEYAPVVARAVGRWHGKQVTFEATYPNACTAAAQSADIFAF